MNENEVLNLKFGESVRTENGDKYTKTIGGWIYQTFSGQVCFIPDGVVKENLTTERADKKAKEK
jgi:hypothetical protein